jgi:hypothetical protein
LAHDSYQNISLCTMPYPDVLFHTFIWAEILYSLLLSMDKQPKSDRKFSLFVNLKEFFYKKLHILLNKFIQANTYTYKIIMNP